MDDEDKWSKHYKNLQKKIQQKNYGELITCAFNVFHTNFLIKHNCVLTEPSIFLFSSRSLFFSLPVNVRTLLDVERTYVHVIGRYPAHKSNIC